MSHGDDAKGRHSRKSSPDATPLEHAVLGPLALTVLTRRAGPDAGAEAIAAAADRAYDDLARVMAPIIGDVGVSAITDRALHLVGAEHPWLLPARERTHADEKFSAIMTSLKRQVPATAAAAAASVLATMLRLLATFIGDPLASRLVRQAWPDAFSSANTEET